MALAECIVTTDLHNQELKEHGDTSFPIACYADDLKVADVPWHWHEEWEYAIVTEGTPEFLMENHHQPISPGDGIFINSKALHAMENKPGQSGKLHSAVFHPRLIGGSMDSVFWSNLVHPLLSNLSTRFVILHQNIPWQAEVLEHFHTAWHAITEEVDDFENIARFELSRAIRVLLQNIDLSQVSFSEADLQNAERIRIMLQFIEDHFSEDLTVETIASSISVSGSVCLRCFHQTLNTTPMQYVKQLRLKKAAEALKTTKKSAKEIAFDCGFNDISYFTKIFSEVYGMTPGVYRKS